MEERIQELYRRIDTYAETNQLGSTVKALRAIREILENRAKDPSAQTRYQSEFQHCLEVCEILIDLHIPVSPAEEDALLAAVLLHIYPENFATEDLEARLVNEMGFSHRIYEIVEQIVPDRYMMDEEQQRFYARIQEDKLALLAALADRGNVVQQLHRYSTWNAHRYIDETKACYYPMCIYGKEHYHALLAPISVLMEKLKSLLEVAEILLQRYEVREAELIQDIMALREENATIKGIIAKFQE